MSFHVRSRDAMSRREKATFAALLAVYLASLAYYAVWWFRPQNIPSNWPDLGYLGLGLDTLLFLTLSFIIWRGVILNLFAFWTVSAMKTPIWEAPPEGLRVAMITCFVPGKEPFEVLEKTLTAMKNVGYPHDTWVLDEGDDLVVKSICRQLGAKHFTRKGVPEYNQSSGKYRIKTKSGNLNAWVDRHGQEYDVVSQMDVDFIPRPELLERTLGYFRDAKVAFVGTPQIHGNQSESWVAKGAAEQVFIFYGPMQKGLFGRGMQMLIGGNHLFRTEAWRDIDGYSESVTEDHVTGMKVYAKGWKSVFVPEALLVGEVPADMLTYLGQQMRWAYGLTDILFRYTPGLIRKLNWTQRLGYLNLQLFYFFGLAHFLGIVLVSLYLAFGVRATAAGFTDWALHAAPPFLISIAVFKWLQKFCIDPEAENVLGLKGIILFFAVWPAIVLGLYHALMRHRLFYNITRKGSTGNAAADRPSLHFLIPYFISAAISLFGLITFPLSGQNFPPMVFWALLNFGTMVAAVLALWQPAVPAPAPTPAPVGMRSLRRALPVAVATVTAAAVFFASIGVPALVNVSPYGTLLASAQQIGTMEPTQARFLEPGSPSVAIGALANSWDELEANAKISHLFVTWRSEDLGWIVEGVRAATANNQVAMITWQPTFLTVTDMSPTRAERATILQRIEKGEFDSYISEVATLLRNTGQPVLLRFAHEMDIDDDGFHPWASQTPELYIAAFRHVHRIFEQEQASNVRWIWSPSGYWKGGRLISTDWYPGDQYVDMIGLSILVFWQWDEWDEERRATHRYRTPKEIIEPTYNQLLQLGKPFILAEIGADLHPEKKAERKEWMQSMLELVRQEHFSDIVAVVFFNWGEPSGWDADWRLNEEEMSLVVNNIKADEYFELSPREEREQLAKRGG